MSRLFDATTERITFGTTAVPQTAGSIAFWFKPNWAHTDGANHVLWDVETDASHFFRIQKHNLANSNQLIAGWRDGAGGDHRIFVSSAGYTLTAGVWHHMIMTWDDTANATVFYLNGSSIGSTATLTTFTSTSNRTIGNALSGVADLNCDASFAEFAIFDRALNTGERSALATKVSPLRIGRSGLVDYLPLYGHASPEPNYVGGATAGTVTGATQADHAPVQPTWGFDGGGWLGAFGAAAAETITVDKWLYSAQPLTPRKHQIIRFFKGENPWALADDTA